jgi:hypothetical protein
MSNSTSLRQWIENFNAGIYAANNTETQTNAGWYDWFCREGSLLGKTNALAPKVKRLAKSPKINPNTMYVWFKNNCPLYGNLYDDFRFADIETGEVIYTIIPSSGHQISRGRAEVWGRENDFHGPLVTGTWKDVLAYFKV